MPRADMDKQTADQLKEFAAYCGHVIHEWQARMLLDAFSKIQSGRAKRASATSTPEAIV